MKKVLIFSTGPWSGLVGLAGTVFDRAKRGLHPDWESATDTFIASVKPHISSGKAIGVFMGEPRPPASPAPASCRLTAAFASQATRSAAGEPRTRTSARWRRG